MRKFILRMQPSPGTRILDVGGYPDTWEDPVVPGNITLLNIHPIDLSKRACYGRIKAVIEHVGTWERQMAFAAEMRRVGKALWIQTPARSFFIEPHLITPFIYYFPRSIQSRLLRHFTLWGMMTKPTASQVEDFLNEIRLLNANEVKQLFPDCEILKERIAGVTKSYIAMR